MGLVSGAWSRTGVQKPCVVADSVGLSQTRWRRPRRPRPRIGVWLRLGAKWLFTNQGVERCRVRMTQGPRQPPTNCGRGFRRQPSAARAAARQQPGSGRRPAAAPWIVKSPLGPVHQRRPASTRWCVSCCRPRSARLPPISSAAPGGTPSSRRLAGDRADAASPLHTTTLTTPDTDPTPTVVGQNLQTNRP